MFRSYRHFEKICHTLEAKIGESNANKLVKDCYNDFKNSDTNLKYTNTPEYIRAQIIYMTRKLQNHYRKL